MRETASISTLENVKLFDLICGYFNVPVQPTNSLKKRPIASLRCVRNGSLCDLDVVLVPERLIRSSANSDRLFGHGLQGG